MRLLAILLLAACSSNASPKPSPATKCPVGDGINTAVYTFLERELDDAAAEDIGRPATRDLLARDVELESKPDMKPLRASVIEREISNALTTLCAGAPGCNAIGLYTRNGMAIALSSLHSKIAPLGFADDARWATLGKLREGQLIDLTAAEAKAAKLDQATHTLAVFPVESGVAMCIVER